MAESHELYQKCRHYLENQKIKKMKLLKLRKVFFMYKDICHQLASELYL